MLHEQPLPGYTKRVVQYGPYSPSSLIVAKCPQRFFAEQVRKDRGVTSSISAARGSAIHHVLSKITESIVAGTQISPSQLNNWVNEGVGLFPASYDQIDLVKGAANAYIAKPSPYINQDTSCEKAFAVQFWEEESFVDNVIHGKIYTPTTYALEDGKTPNLDSFFRGKLDQISVDHVIKTVTILDHKSVPNAAKNENHTFQVGAYAWLVSLFYPGYTIKTVIHYAHPALAFYTPPMVWTPDDLRDVEGYIHNRIWSIESFSEFPAVPGDSCDYCHIVQECPTNLAVMEQRARGAIDLNVHSFADLKRLAQNLHTVGALYDELNKSLKKGIEKYAPQNGVSIEGMWYGFKTSDESIDWIATDFKIREESQRAKQLLVSDQLDEETRKKYELQAQLPDLASVLVRFGVQPDAFKEWQGQKLKNLWKLEKPGLLEMLKDYVVRERSTRWGKHKG